MGEKKALPKNRQELIDKLIDLFSQKNLRWTKGWQQQGQPLPPVSGTTGQPYRGVNNLMLWLTAIECGYQDNRWVTFNQIEKNGWSFKKDKDGLSLGKGAGVPVEIYRHYDTKTKKDLDWEQFRGMTLDEQQNYWEENVRIFARTYIVFNGDVIEGFPAREQRKYLTQEERHERSELIIRAWNERQCTITHDGGDRAYYTPSEDKIHLPERTAFFTLEDYYSTALHEMGHSTGHPSRMNRDLSGGFGSEKYAIEELRAEFASVFMQQELGLSMSDLHIQNHAAYLQSWAKHAKENPDAVFAAIKDATKITQCIFDNAAALESQMQSRQAAEMQAQATTHSSALWDMVGSMPTVGGPQGSRYTENVNE